MAAGGDTVGDGGRTTPPSAHESGEEQRDGARREPEASNAATAVTRRRAATRVDGGLEPGPLDHRERRQLDVVRRFGTTGALMLGVGAIGAGAAPVDNPLSGIRLIGLPARIPTVAMACAWLGMLMIVAAWLWLGTLSWPGRARMVSRSQLDRTVIMWGIPFAIAPPLFSRDMYAYLAQSEVAARGLDPYVLGPAFALGVDNPFTSNVPNIWRDTPAPYGPLFLLFGRGIAMLVGDNIVFGVLVWRVIMLIGLGLAIWAIPRLAERCGVHPVAALWLSAANPLVFFHVVSGMHNEALLVGVMLAGIELGLRYPNVWGLIGAGTLLVIGGAIKPPGFIALGFFGIYVARLWGARYRDLFTVAAILTAVFLAGMTVITVASGWGLGWVETFDVPNRLKTWVAPLTGLAGAGGGIGMLFGLGNHTEQLLNITKVVGYTLIGGICLRLLWTSFHGRIDPMRGLGITLGALALFGPVLHPWYLLWALVPLALAVHDTRFRLGAVAISAVLALSVQPTGAGFELRAFVLPLAVTAALIAFAVTLLLVRGKVPSLWPPPGRASALTS